MNTPARIKILNELLLSDDVGEGSNAQVNCPAPALLDALVEDGLETELGRSLWEHVSTCPSCHDLYARLCAFSKVDAVASPEQDRAWQAAKHRLEIAVKTVSASSKPERSVEASRGVPWLLELTRRSKWALSFCTVLLVAGISLLVFDGFAGRGPNIERAKLVRPASVYPTNEPEELHQASPMGSSQTAATPSQFESSQRLSGDAKLAPILEPAAPGLLKMTSFVLSAGTRVQLEIVSARAGQDSTFVVEGRLILSPRPGSPSNFEVAQFSGTLSTAVSTGQISIRQITRDGETYSVVPAPDVRVTIERTDEIMQAGQTLRGHISREATFNASLR